MMNLIRQIAAIIMLGCLILALLYIGVAVALVALGVGAVAAVWCTIRFYILRKDIRSALREYHSMAYSDALRPGSPRPGEDAAVNNGEVIEVEYTEISTPPKREQ